MTAKWTLSLFRPLINWQLVPLNASFPLSPRRVSTDFTSTESVRNSPHTPTPPKKNHFKQKPVPFFSLTKSTMEPSRIWLGQEMKSRKEGAMERRGALIRKETGLMYEPMSFHREGEKRGCGVRHCPSFYTVPVSPVAPQNISTRLINATITTIASNFEGWKKKNMLRPTLFSAGGRSRRRTVSCVFVRLTQKQQFTSKFRGSVRSALSVSSTCFLPSSRQVALQQKNSEHSEQVDQTGWFFAFLFTKCSIDRRWWKERVLKEMVRYVRLYLHFNW